MKIMDMDMEMEISSSNIDFYKCYDTIFNYMGKVIKVWYFYIGDELNVLEYNMNELSPSDYKFYLNNMLIDKNEVECCMDMIIATQYINIDHEDFIHKVEKYLGSITYNSQYNYGWSDKSIPYQIIIDKYKKITCRVNLGESCYIFNKEETLEFIEKEMSVYILNKKMNVSSLRVNTTVEPIKQKCKKYEEKEKTSYSHLFISYSKRERLEFQSCKTYDIQEIALERFINDSINESINESINAEMKIDDEKINTVVNDMDNLKLSN